MGQSLILVYINIEDFPLRIKKKKFNQIVSSTLVTSKQ